MSCTNKISKNFVRECGYKPKQGVKDTIYLVNSEDIDRAATQLNTSKTSISSMVLKTSAKLYAFEGNDKSFSASSEVVVGDYGNGEKHSVSITPLYFGDAQREVYQKILEGARLVAIVKRVDTGLNGELSYEVYGYESGMVISEGSRNLGENSGVKTFTIASKEGEEESTDAKIFFDTDLETTEEWIADNVYTPTT